jgi:tetratricopeptide (TPR) repeat protein
MLEAAGARDEAEAAVVEAIEVSRRSSGPTHPSVAITTAQLANLRCARDDFGQAGTHYENALSMLEAIFPPSHPRVLDARGAYARCLTRAAQYARAEALLIASFEALGGSAATNTANSPARRVAAGLADLYDAWRRPDDAALYRTLADTTGGR